MQLRSRVTFTVASLVSDMQLTLLSRRLTKTKKCQLQSCVGMQLQSRVTLAVASLLFHMQLPPLLSDKKPKGRLQSGRRHAVAVKQSRATFAVASIVSDMQLAPLF